jgi:histidinol-phosphate aminotransferase
MTAAITAIDQLIPRHVRELRPYLPGKPVEEVERELGIVDAIKLASNENPLGPSPMAMEAMARALADSHLYPDDSAYRLRRKVAERLDATPDELIFGAGSNELIYLLVAALCSRGDQVLTHEFAFISYALAARAHDVEVISAPATSDLRCDVDALIAAMSPRTKIILLANPNNPTGSHLTTAELERVIGALAPNAFLVIDEAYYEYALAFGGDYGQAIRYQRATPRLIILRTFSKLHGLAGLRVGYGLGPRRVIDYVNRLRRAFNVGSLAQAAALAALDDVEHAVRGIAMAQASLERMRSALTMRGLLSYPSLGNFVLIDVGRPSQPLYDALLLRGVITRPLAGWGLPNHLRVSVGTPDQTERFVAAIHDVV